MTMIRKQFVNLLSAAAICCLSTGTVMAQSQTASSSHDWYSGSSWSTAEFYRTENDLPHGYTSTQLQYAIQKKLASETEKKYGLEPGWKAAEYCRKYALDQVSYTRATYNLFPNFSSVDYFKAQTAKSLNYGVPQGPSFTEQQLRDYAADVPDFTASFDTGWEGDHGLYTADEYKVAAGQHESARIAKDNQLSESWTYSELEDSAGPQEAASLAKRYGFKRTQSHDQIVATIGQSLLEHFADMTGMPVNFSKADLRVYLGNKAVRHWHEDFNDNSGPVDSAWIAQHSIAREMHIFQQINPDMAAQWSEPDLIANIAARKCTTEAESNGLESDFDEASWTKAQAASRIAEIRRNHKLARYFVENDLIQADKLSWRDHYGAY